ncbi:hypothetical protein [Helicobacter bizzozeronii]|nr:hypothetical protein [Helicobacter bizzozeronii]
MDYDNHPPENVIRIECIDGSSDYQPRRKAPSFSYGDIRLAPAWLC